MSYRDRPGGYDTLKWSQDESQRRRRRPWTKWALLFGVVMLILWSIAIVVDGKARPFPNMGILMPLILASGMSPFARASWLTAKGRARYDEFERAAYARATAIAFVLFVVLVAGVFAWLTAATAWRWPMPHGAGDWGAWGISLLLIGSALPLLFAEFMVPFPPASEEWEA